MKYNSWTYCSWHEAHKCRGGWTVSGNWFKFWNCANKPDGRIWSVNIEGDGGETAERNSLWLENISDNSHFTNEPEERLHFFWPLTTYGNTLEEGADVSGELGNQLARALGQRGDPGSAGSAEPWRATFKVIMQTLMPAARFDLAHQNWPRP